MNDVDRMWDDNNMGSFVLDDASVSKATWADPVVKEGAWGLHIVRPNQVLNEYPDNTGTQRQGWKSIISHDCDLNGSPYWMLIEYHSRATVCAYCAEDMPAGVVALFKFHNEDLIR